MDGMSAKARYVRQSPRKVRLVAGLIRGMGVSDALAQLSAVGKAARMPVEKTLRSAMANAENNFQKNRDQLFIKEICVDEGPDLRRFRPRAFGRSAPILKHSCHILIQLGQRALTEDGTVAPHHTTDAAREHLPNEPEQGVLVQAAGEMPGAGTATGRYDAARHTQGKEQKQSKGFMKKIIQRKTG